MPKLAELKGKENLPERIKYVNMAGLEDYGFNMAVEEYNQLEIDGEVEELARLLADHRGGHKGFPPAAWDYMLSEYIISNISKFLVIKKGV